MKRYIKHLIILVITITLVIPSAFAQVDITRSFYVLRNDSAANAFVEGGEWLIEFSNKDTLGNEYDYPVAMNFKGAYYADSTFMPMQAVDSVQFEQPSTIMKPGVFRLTEDHYQYIVDTDGFTTIRFRIDCISKIDLPKVGQKVISEIYKDPLPFGFLGRVESLKVSYDEGCIVMVCEIIKLSDVYDRLYSSKVKGKDEEVVVKPQYAIKSTRIKPLSFEDNYDSNDKIELVDGFDLPLPDVGLVSTANNNDFKFSLTPMSETAQFKAYAINNKASAKIYSVTVIDAGSNVDYVEDIVDLSLTSTLGVQSSTLGGAAESWKEKHGSDIPLKFKKSFAPKCFNIMVLDKDESLGSAYGYSGSLFHPSAYWRLDYGLLVDLAIDLQLKMEDTFTTSLQIGIRQIGDEHSPVLRLNGGPSFNANQINFDLGYATALNLKAGAYANLKLSWVSVLDFVAEACFGTRLDGAISTNFIGLKETIDAKESTISDLTAQLDHLNNTNYFKVQCGLMLDGRVDVLKGHIKTWPILDYLKKFPSINKVINGLLSDVFVLDAVPKYSFNLIGSSDDIFAGTLYSNKRFIFNHELGLLLKDATLDSEDPTICQKISLGKVSEGKPSIEFSLNRDDYKQLKGIPLNVYSYLAINPNGSLAKYCSTGKLGEMEFPYESKVSQMIGDDYTYVAVDVEVDPDAAEDEDYTQSGILVWKDGKKEETGIRLIGNENYAVNATIQFDRKMFSDYRNDIKSNMDYCVKPWVYDAKRDRYVYGEQSKFKLNSLVGPKTMPATDITYNSAYLKGNVHEEFFNYIDGDFEIIFSYWIPGETAETVLKYDSSDYPDIATTLAFEALVMGLRPNTEYEYRVGLNYSSDGFFGGDPVKFKTKNVISNLKHEAGSDFAILYADISTDYIAKNCKIIYFEVVEEDKDFSSAKTKIVDEGDFIVNDDGTTTVDVIFYDLIPSLEYKYRLVFVDDKDNKIYSNIGTFSTDATALKAITKGAAVKGNVVVLKGNLSLDLVRLLESQGIKKVYFGYSKLSDMSNKVTVEADFVDTYSTVTLSDLSYGSTYYYYFYAIDADNNVYEGDVLSFVTDASPLNTPETCFTLEADVNDANVTMMGGVPPLQLPSIVTGFYRNIQYGFEVAEKQSDLKGKMPTFATDVIDKETGIFTITKILQPNTTYYIRAMVFYNDRWVAAPEVVSVKTADFDPNLKPPEIDKQ